MNGGKHDGVRVALDYDLFVADVIWPAGEAPGILPMALDGCVTAVYDERVLANYGRALSDVRLGLDPEDVRGLMARLSASGSLVKPSRRSSVAGLDEWDRSLMSCAIAARADALVSLSPVRFGHLSVKNVKILDPAKFAAMYMARLSLMGDGEADRIGRSKMSGDMR